MASKKKPPTPPVDGLSPNDIKRIRIAVRRVWQWSTPRKIAIQRAVKADGFFWCEGCLTRAPKIYVDHKTPVGDVDEGFIERLFCSSENLQSLCKSCHDRKTREERSVKKS